VKNIIVLLFLQVNSIAYLKAQIFPDEGARLNFTQVMFDYADAPAGSKYKIQIIEDEGAPDFSHPLIEKTDSTTATLINGLQFGKKYIWRYGVQKARKTFWSNPVHFNIQSIPENQTLNAGLKLVESKTGRMNQGIIMVDILRTAIDFAGNPVWFLPTAQIGVHQDIILDLRLNKRGTITFLDARRAYECGLSGNVKWFYPDSATAAATESSRIYHHDFQHLPDGNYMMLYNEKRWKKIPSYFDIKTISEQKITINRGVRDSLKTFNLKGGGRIRNTNDSLYEAEIEYGGVLELDTSGKTIWKWDCENYLSENEIFPPGDSLHKPSIAPDPHINAFCTDENEQYVYVSFRNLSRVIKIEKKSGKVVSSWGTNTGYGNETRFGDGFFHKQHAIMLTGDKNLMVFDNEDTANAKNSMVLEFTDPEGNDTSKIIWDYECKFDSVSGISPRGGNVEILPNGDYLVSMGGLPRVFEVTYGKKIVWSALISKKDPASRVIFGPNRAHYMSSLYPCYFSVSLNKEFLNRKDKLFQLKIFNKGSGEDSYSIQVTGGPKNKRTLNTPVVKADSSATLKIPCFKNLSFHDQVVIKISSKTNPDFQRTKLLSYKR
jgi:hypothetical protein